MDIKEFLKGFLRIPYEFHMNPNGFSKNSQGMPMNS